MVKITYLMDIGASAMGFIDRRFAKVYKILIIKLIKLLVLRLANNEHVLNITYIAQIIFALEGHINKV